jgi:hypothetical protein
MKTLLKTALLLLFAYAIFLGVDLVNELRTDQATQQVSP